MENKELGVQIHNKTTLLNNVIDNTKQAFELMRSTSKQIIEEFAKSYPKEFIFTDKGDFEFEIRFGSDILVFMMHTNVFEFLRYHEVMKLPYVLQDKNRSFSGMINIYNFLTDSFDYNRDYDIGYLIGRVFINKENHYFIEGKREVGLMYTSFHKAVIEKDSIYNIIVSSLQYVNNFDLLTPPFDEVKITTVGEIQSNLSTKKQITGKRLGFEFKQDKD